MPEFTQQNRRFRVTTALGPDALLLTGFTGREAVSQLFRFELELLAPLDAPADFKSVLGQPALLELDLPDGQVRYVHGIVNRFAQGGRDGTFISYRAEVVPALWQLTRREQSRVFQHLTAQEILAKVFAGLPVRWDLREPLAARDYCVQYRESDFAFASRLLEEEGIYYYFTHARGGHTLVLSDHPQGHVAIPAERTLVYEQAAGGAGTRKEYLVTDWQKVQELRSGKVTLWDHNFELPHKPLDAESKLPESVKVGTVTHPLAVGETPKLERYDYPGGYAEWFDGVNPGGADQAGNLQHIFEQNKRLAKLRIQEEAAAAVRIDGDSACGNLTAGHAFTLTRHFDADGDYVLTEVTHTGRAEGDFRSGGGEFAYENRFVCIPKGLTFRPPRVTPRPTVKGTQTAVVVGPPGEEIFTDKYGRVKVQFHWDREGKHNADSSCWIRVATPWAGKGWGMIHIPRIGHEVVVDFLEGDPDRPIILGSVYNADHVPPGSLPKEGMVSGLISRSTKGGGAGNFNGIRSTDTKGKEHLLIHAEYDQAVEVEHNETHWVGLNRTKTVDKDETTHVKNNRTETVDSNETITIHGNRTETVDKNETITVTGNRTESVAGAESISVSKTQALSVTLAQTVTVGLAQTITVGAAQTVSVGAVQAVTVGGPQTITVGGSASETIGGKWSQTVAKDHATVVAGGRTADVGKDDTLKVAKKLLIEAGEEVSITTGDASIIMKKDGSITIKGKDIVLKGSGKITATADGDMTLKGSKIGHN